MDPKIRDNAVFMLGETLLIIQKFEQLLVAVLLNIVSNSDVDKKFEQALIRDKETLGKLLKYFATHAQLPEHFTDTFDGLLERRNVLVHKLFMEPWFDLKTEDGCARLQDFLREIRARAKVAVYVMMASIPENSAVSKSSGADERLGHILERIYVTAEPNFGDLTADQYVAKVQQEALDTMRRR